MVLPLFFQTHVPEKLIQQRTGHRSLEALRQYERISDAQLLDVSNVMSGTSDTMNPSNNTSLAVAKEKVVMGQTLKECSLYLHCQLDCSRHLCLL